MRTARVAVLSSLLFLSASFLEAEEPVYRTLLIGGVFADSSIVGPFARWTTGDPETTQYSLSLVGWTLEGQWVRHRTPRHALIVSADATPINAHLSDRIYVDRDRAKALEYDAASYRVRGGLRLTPNDRSATDILLVGLIEQVDDLDDAAEMRFWDRPFVGLDLAHTYHVVRSDRPLISSADGFAVTGRIEVFSGAHTWSRASVGQRMGFQAGKIHLRESVLVVTGKSLNTVSRFLIGGSWDALGESALYGYRYGEFRIARGVVVNAGADYLLPRDWRVGVRGSYLRSDVARVHGLAVNATKSWKTFGFNMGVGLPERHNGKSDPVLYLAIIAPLYAK